MRLNALLLNWDPTTQLLQSDNTDNILDIFPRKFLDEFKIDFSIIYLKFNVKLMKILFHGSETFFCIWNNVDVKIVTNARVAFAPPK